MSGERPAAATGGLHHVALKVCDLEQCADFYIRLLGMKVEWRPDEDNVYLSSGNDNLALHRVQQKPAPGCLDHLGFVLPAAADVDRWHAWLNHQGVPIQQPPRSHRDGARSFYCLDPEGVVIQFIYHPPLRELARGNAETSAPGQAQQ